MLRAIARPILGGCHAKLLLIKEVRREGW